jgi:hypothetical protein
VVLTPECSGIRVAVRETDHGAMAFLFNEEETPWAGKVQEKASHACCMDPQTGTVTRMAVHDGHVALSLFPGETVLLWFSEQPIEAQPACAPTEAKIVLDENLHAVARRHFIVGEQDYETVEAPKQEATFAKAAAWKDWLGSDFSGEVDYTAEVVVPEDWTNAPMQLDVNKVEYAATVLLDGHAAGTLLWPPWRVALPPCTAGTHTLTIRVANTLANELTSDRVRDAWSKKKGPGWPSPYHERALKFEVESRGGGLAGPVTLTRMEVNGK